MAGLKVPMNGKEIPSVDWERLRTKSEPMMVPVDLPKYPPIKHSMKLVGQIRL